MPKDAPTAVIVHKKAMSEHFWDVGKIFLEVGLKALADDYRMDRLEGTDLLRMEFFWPNTPIEKENGDL